ncbi:hypothetical protein [Rhodococcus sp. W8901]|uniref:hypothetical protein n=1 Tax=Rhodococcus sp. W8901 TaxID=2742603 RepID=UPI0020C66A50|nr:hypothetical protein [Rhodococcus sp. W8901]
MTPTGPVTGRNPVVPEALGPVLEWSRPTHRDLWLITGGMVALLVVYLTVVNGFQWITMWPVWLFIALVVPFTFWRFGGEWFAAGAVWAQLGKSWVNTYELVEIKFSVDGLNRVLRLKDSSGRQIYSFRLRNMQANPRMWDLVYNGILHSVASGNCEVTPKARKVLMLPAGLGE